MRRSWHDDLVRLCNSNAHTTVRRTYCEQHRKLQLDNERRNKQNQHYYEFSENESLVNSLESSTTAGSECRFERRLIQQLESPTMSCLKSVTDTKKNKNKKQVNFACEEEEEEEQSTHYTYASSSISSSQQSSSIRRNATAIVRRSNDYVNQGSSTCQPTIAEDIMQSSTSALEELSLTSSSRSHFTAKNKNNSPRIVKPRDVLRRPATRKMMIYPPEGQRGEPLTLNKKWSKIQCRVNGDVETGFRYKVYYLQTFESDKWFPNNKTNSPFYHLPNDDDDNDDDDNSTDYGNLVQ